MINGKRIAVVLPAYNAEKTLEATVRELPDLVDIRILVDDHSSDRTVEIAHRLGLQSFVHDRNYGYGRNQQTCYREALAAGADVVIMVHPDYQYTPLLVTAMASMIAYGVYDVVLGSRIHGRHGAARRHAALQIHCQPLADRSSRTCSCASSSRSITPDIAPSAAKCSPVCRCAKTSDDFVFDNQMLAQCVIFGFRIGEVSCPTKYFEEASSINFRRSVQYGLGVRADLDAVSLAENGASPFRNLQSQRPPPRARFRRPLLQPERQSERFGSIARRRGAGGWNDGQGPVGQVTLAESPISQTKPSLPRWTWLALLLLTAFAIVVQGYHPGLEDDAYYLAAIKHNLNPALFPYDADFFQVLFRATAFDKLMAFFVRWTHIPLAWSLLAWQFAATFLILWGCWRIARRCFAEVYAQWAAVALVAVLLTLPVSGTALTLTDQYLHPRALATALILAAIVAVLDENVGARRSCCWQHFPCISTCLRSAHRIVCFWGGGR